MVITTCTALIRTMVVYRLVYMKKSGNRLFRCPDFVIHYTSLTREKCSVIAFWPQRSWTGCYTTQRPLNIKGGSYQLKEKRKAGLLAKGIAPESDDELAESGQHR